MSGHYRQYKDHSFSAKSLTLIGYANEIIEVHAAMGLDMTVRQIHYQLVNRPDYANTQSNYNKLGKLLSKGREAGLVSWTAIKDRGRGLRTLGYNEYPTDVFKGLDAGYRLNKWRDQDWYPVVGVEKQALEGVIADMCYDLEVPFIAFKGYSSASTSWELGQRLARAVQRGQRPIIFHLGDHDPSGIDMTRDTQERLSLFAGTQIIVQRLALNMPQIEQYKPHPNPLKTRADGELSDSRGRAYEEQFGDESWELDALDPFVIQGLIRDAVERIRDEAKWQASLTREVDDKRYIKELVDSLGLHIEDEEDGD